MVISTYPTKQIGNKTKEIDVMRTKTYYNMHMMKLYCCNCTESDKMGRDVRMCCPNHMFI